MIPYNLSEIPVFTLLLLSMFAMVVFRYFLAAGLFYFYFYIWNPAIWEKRKISTKPYPKRQFIKEIAWSLLTSFIFSFAGALTAVFWQQGYTLIYLETGAFGWFYAFFSLVLVMFLHETYYYWLHRWMHLPKVYRLVHQVHHDSLIASPWTAFSFHPLESILQALVLPLFVLLIPMHPYTIVLYLTIMTFSSVINHLDIEIYPQGAEKNWLGKWFIGATHHSLHHQQFKYNYGLYFTFWDKWMQTESPLFQKLFSEKTTKRSR